MIRACPMYRSRILVWTMVVIVAMSAIGISYAAPQAQLPEPLSPFSLSPVEQTGIIIGKDGSIILQNDAPPPPSAEPGYERYGLVLSSPRMLAKPALIIRTPYEATIPDGSMIRIDVRGSIDGQSWTAWEPVTTEYLTTNFPHPVGMIQYRVVLLGSNSASPVVHSLSMIPADDGPIYQAFDAQETDVAPTYKIRATRLGMVGGRTANGHIIKRNDRFVALPSWRALCSKNGTEYQVRITYRGKSVVAPVWDVGPWNTRDDYWSVNRERYQDLPRGWPQDHAAYYDGYNGRRAEKGYVRFPTAMDVGDGVWWELGIPGDQGSVEVTFLWLGRDPLAEPEHISITNTVATTNTAVITNTAATTNATTSTAAITNTATITGTAAITNTAVITTSITATSP